MVVHSRRKAYTCKCYSRCSKDAANCHGDNLLTGYYQKHICWICQEELSSEGLLLEHYENRISSFFTSLNRFSCHICYHASGESTRLPPMWPGFDSQTRYHMWVEFVLGFRPCSERFFSGYSGFSLC